MRVQCAKRPRCQHDETAGESGSSERLAITECRNVAHPACRRRAWELTALQAISSRTTGVGACAFRSRGASKLLNHEFALIRLDVFMPGMEGRRGGGV